MTSPNNDDLNDRLERLENRMAMIEEALGIRSAPDEIMPEERELDQLFSNSFEEKALSTDRLRFKKYLKSDFWIGKLGILMLIMGVAFFFNYAISEGWLGETAQLTTGVAFGLILHILGKRVTSNVLELRSVLQGGSIVTFYATLLAGSLLYQLVPVWLTFLLAFLILLFASRVAASEQNPWIAGIASAGALVVIVVFSENISVLSTVTSGWIVALFGLWFYYKFKWHMVMDISGVGSLLIVTILLIVKSFNFEINLFRELLVGIQIASYWLIIIVLPQIINGSLRKKEIKHVELRFTKVIGYLSVPVLVMIWFNSIWNFSDRENALIFFLIATLHHSWGYVLYRTYRKLVKEIELAFYTGQLLFTGSIFILLDGPLFWIIFAAQGAIWIVYLKSTSFWWKLPGHLVMLISTLYIGWWFENERVIHLFDAHIIGVLLIISMFAFVAYKKQSIRDIYGLAVHLFLLAWLYKACSVFEMHNVVVTISWFLYVSLLIALGFGLRLKKLRTLSFVTLLLITAKFLFVDMNNVAPVIRISILIVLGVILLGLSYYFGNTVNDEVGNIEGKL